MKMKKTTLGPSGIECSAIGLGTWAMGGWMWGGGDNAAAEAAIQASLDAGVTLIDTAPAYGLGRSESIVGTALKGRRHEAVIATKCGLVWHTQKGTHFFEEDGHPVYRYLGRESIFHECEESLKRLQTDYIDLYITHWQDSTTPVAETMDALLALKKEGKIRAIGVSNVSPETLAEYLRHGPVDAAQERYSLIDREIEQTLAPCAASTTWRCSAIRRWRSACSRGPSIRHASSRATTSAQAIRASAKPTVPGSRPSSRRSSRFANSWAAPSAR